MRDLLRTPTLSPTAILPRSLTPPPPRDIWTSDAPIRPLHRARKPILHIRPQLRIHRELRRLGTLSTTLSMSLGGRGSIFNAATSDRGIALQLTGDRRRRTTEPTRDRSHPTTTREQDRDLLPLGGRQITPRHGHERERRHPATLAEPPDTNARQHTRLDRSLLLDAPRAIASQNRTRCSRRPAGGCPPQRAPAAAARLHARFLLSIATPQLRRCDNQLNPPSGRAAILVVRESSHAAGVTTEA